MIPTGVQVDVVIKEETTNGVAADGASGGVYLRRVSCDLDLSKDTYESDEIVKHYQVQDMRHGMRKVSGALRGRLAPGAYALPVGHGLRRAFTTGVTSTATTYAATTAAFTDSGTGFLAAGYKNGDIVVPAGFSGSGTGNNGRYYLIQALTAGTMAVTNPDGSAPTLVADAAGESVVLSVVGKKTWVPTTGHINKAVTVEKLYHTTTPISEVYVGVKQNTIDILLPATGLAGIDFGMIGVNRMPLGTAAYFAAPAAASTVGIAAAVNGALMYQGSVIGVITNLGIKIDNGMTTGAVVGRNYTPDVFVGRVRVSGQIDAYLEDAAFLQAFDNETEVSIVSVFTLDSSSAPKFISVVMPRVKLGDAKKSDSEGPIMVTAPFTALYNSAGGANQATEQTTISIQDSDA